MSNYKPTYRHAGARSGPWEIKEKNLKKKKIEKKKNFFDFFDFFFDFLKIFFNSSETTACPCVPKNGFNIGAGPPLTDFVVLKVPAINNR